MKQNAFFHLFKTRNCCYIYDVNTNLFLKVPKETYSALENYNGDLEALKDDSVILNLKEKGYLSSNRAEEIEHSLTDALESILDNSLNTLTLQITQECNLRCSYCVYSGSYLNRSHSHKIMSIDTAKKGIDFIINHSKNSPTVNFAFYGGEPLLRFNFIKECVAYAKEKGEGKKITFNMTINGTLLTDEIIKFMKDNEVSLLISMDGPKEIHDKNRVFSNGMGSFDKIMNNINKIKVKFPEYVEKNVGFNIVMDGQNDFSYINNFFANYDTVKDSRVNATDVSTLGALEEKAISEDFIQDEKYERFKILLHKLGKLDEKYISKLLLSQFEHINHTLNVKREANEKVPKKMHPGGPCIPGLNRLFMTVDGKFCPCERVNEESEAMNIGNVNAGFEIEKIKKLINVGEMTKQKCKNCWAFRYCYLCAAFADDMNELSGVKRAKFCNDVKRNTEEMFKVYCTMMEFGYKFEE